MRVLLILKKIFFFWGGEEGQTVFFYGDHLKIDDHQKATFWKK